jgi:glycosyltransferase involved in cell wall biosynthesis
MAAKEKVPDIIVASYPIPELARAGADYARKHSIPSVVDVRDLWPDIWASVLPKPFRWLGAIALIPLQLRLGQSLRRFSSICGITENAVEWALRRAKRRRSPWDRSFPLAYQKNQYTPKELTEARIFWSDRLGEKSAGKIRLCFFGIIRQRLRIDVMIEGIRCLPPEIRDRTELVICGEGANLAELRSTASTLPQVHLPGWVNGPQIEVLASTCDAGILPYASDTEFIHLLPNKVIEYLAYGLPVLSSLRGPVSDLITQADCGRIYRETDAHDLARTIADLVTNPEQLGVMSINAQKAFRERFMASEVYGRYADLLRELIRHGATRK